MLRCSDSMCVVEGDLCVTWATVLSRRYQRGGFGFWGYRASRACDCAVGCVCECLLLCGVCMYQSAATAFWCNINRCLPASPGALRHLWEFVYDQLITQSKHTSMVIVSSTRERKWFHPFFPEATFFLHFNSMLNIFCIVFSKFVTLQLKHEGILWSFCRPNQILEVEEKWQLNFSLCFTNKNLQMCCRHL